MAIACPFCHSQQEVPPAKFGTLVACENCQQTFLVGWDGQPQAAPDSAPDSVSETEPDNDFGSRELEPSSDPSSESEASSESEFPKIDLQQFAPTEVMPPAFQESETQVVNFNAIPQGSPGEDFQAIEQEGGFSEEAAAGGDFFSEAETPASSAIGREMEDFGNALESQPLSYDFKIEGIETPELLSQLKDALTDSRLGWDTPLLISSIAEGSLLIKAVPGPKAIVLYNRIKFINIDIKITQALFSVSPPTP